MLFNLHLQRWGILIGLNGDRLHAFNQRYCMITQALGRKALRLNE
jgi:hypothetical protein